MEGHIYEGKFAFQIRFASLIVGSKFSFLLCLSLYLRAISKYKPPVGAYIWRGDLTEAFLCYEFGGGLIFGGAYTWRRLFSEFYGIEFFLGPVWFRGEGTQQSFIRGGSAPRSRPLPFFII